MGSLELISWICRSTYLHIFISDDNLNGLIACLLLWVQDRMIVSKNWPGKSCSCWVFVLQTLPPRILLSTWFWSCLPPGIPYWFIRFKTGWWFDRPTPATQNRNEKSIRYRFQVKTQHFNKRKLSSWSIVVVSEKWTDAQFAWRGFAQFLIPSRPRWSPPQARSWSICCGQSSTKTPTRRRETDFLTWRTQCQVSSGCF